MPSSLSYVRNRTLAAMSVNDILDIVADAAQLWADPDFELRRQAELLIPAITGYEPDMVRIELKRYMRQFRRRELLRFLDSEIGQPSMLDEFRRTRRGDTLNMWAQRSPIRCSPAMCRGFPCGAWR